MFQELKNTILLWRIWGIATIYQIVLQYRRTYLGTIWLAAGLVMIVGAKSFLFAGVLNVPTERIIPNIAIGLLLWRYFSGSLSASCNSLLIFKPYFESNYYPLFVPIFRVIVNQTFIFFHGLIPMLIISFYFYIPGPETILYLIGGLILSFFTILPLGFLVALISTRYRDFTAFFQSSMRIVYFMTPVIWLPEMAKGKYELVLLLNPFFHLIEIIRDPLLGQPIDPQNWLIVFGIGVIGWLLVAYSYRQHARRILVWL